MFMRKASGKPSLEMSRKEWLKIGRVTGWTERLKKQGKWGKETNVPESEQGKWTNYSVEELRSKVSKAKEQQEKYKKAHEGKADSKLTEKIRELNFAIRANTGWGKTK